jgi:hypothetical protein
MMLLLIFSLTTTFDRKAQAAQDKTYIFVINRLWAGNGALTEYAVSDGNRKVISALSGRAWSLIVDGDTIFVQTANDDAATGTFTGAVTQYDVGTGSPLLTIAPNIGPAYWMAIDSQGTLYVPTQILGRPASIQEYAKGSLLPKATIRDGIVDPRTIVIDRSDTLYVANVGTQSSVQIYPRGWTKPARTIDRGIGVPEDIAVGDDGTLYVAATEGWAVKVYGSGGTQVIRRIAEDGEPQRLAISPTGLLAVQCDDRNGSNIIDLYPIHSSKRLARIVPHSGDRFAAIGFDNHDNLYAGEEIMPKSEYTFTDIVQFSRSGQRRRIVGHEGGVLNFVVTTGEP